MSGASEATLQELLAVNKATASAIQQLAAKGGGGGGGGGGAPDVKQSGVLTRTFNTSIDAAGKVLSGTFTAAANLASAGMRGLKQTGEALMNNQRQLAQGAIEGTNGLASLTEGLSRLPFGLGLVADVMTYQAKKLEKNLEVYQQISSVGAKFGGSLEQVRQSAASSYLSMSEFAKVMKDAGPQLRYLGSSTEEGAKNLVRFNTGLIQGPVGRGLLGMGYSLEQANGMLASYSEAIGGLKASQLKDQKGMEQSVKFFAEELDAAAQLEGKTREQKEKEMKEAAQQAAVKAKLSEMGPEEQKKYMAAYNAALRVGGKGAAEALQSQLLGLPPMTKAAQQFVAVNGKGAETVKELGKTITDGTKAVDARAKIDKLAAKGQADSAELYKKNSTVFSAISMQGGELAGTINEAAGNMSNMNNLEAKSADDLEARTKQVRDEQKKQQNSQAGVVAQQQGAMKHVGGLMDMLAVALKPLFPIIEKLVVGFGLILPEIIKIGTTVVQTLADAFNEIFAGVSINDIIQPFKDFWKGLFGGGDGVDTKSIKDGIVNFFKPIKDFVGGFFSSIDFEGIGAKVRETFGRVFGALGRIASVFTGILGSGPDPAEAGKGFQKYFNILMDIIGDVADIIASVVEGFVSSPVFETLKTMVDKLVHIFSAAVGFLKEIIQGPVGTYLFEQVYNVMDLLVAPFKFLIDVIDAAIDIVDGIVRIMKGDFEGGMDKISGGIKNLLNGILDWFLRLPKFVAGLFGGEQWFKEITGVVKDFLGKVIDGIKDFFKGVFDIFSSNKDEKKTDKAAQPSTNNTQQPATATQTAQTNTQAAIDKVAQDWAYSVYTNKATLAQVPKDALSKVNEILKNPPNTWKAATAQTNTQAGAAKPAEKPAEKPAPTPAVDLNNKDTLQVLKTIADYQRRTIDALNGLNGNLLKRA